MIRRTRVGWVLSCIMLLAGSVHSQAQPTPQEKPEGQLAGTFRREGEDLKKDCHEKFTPVGCVADFLMTEPVHLAIGSLAPLNGFAIGPAFVYHPPPGETWDVSWSVDAVRSINNGSWRAGGYLTVVHTAPIEPHDVPIDSPDADVSIGTYPVIRAYVQTTSLDRLLFFGLGPDSRLSDASSFGMTETIIGTSAAYPFASSGRWRLSVNGVINGRLVALRDSSGAQEPQLGAKFTDIGAPGLSPPGFVQLGSGVRLTPSVFNNGIQFNYALGVDAFVAPRATSQSFHRWTVDLNHEIPITRLKEPKVSADLVTRGPNECVADAKGRCPVPTINRYGAIVLRMMATRSDTDSSARVPFYFQPTLGGSNVDADRALSAFADYRFRGPRALLFQESIERYLFWFIGGMVLAEQGTVGTTDWGTSSFKRSIAAGVTIRAGNLPLVQLLVANGSEGHRFVAVVSPALLGGSSRPSLR